MYGKSYESMYEGSMIGAGINVFAVWNYIITKARSGAVEVNPKLLAFTLGGTEAEIVAALEFLQRPDPISRSKEEDGRRIIKEGQFQYRVVNWEKYQAIKNAADKREYNRVKQSEYRAKTGKPTRARNAPLRQAPRAYSPGEAIGARLLADGDEAGAAAVQESTLPDWATPKPETPLDNL